ncbi:DUF5672 family protein [Massilia sp. S19_KUP03_FR1]|uniref:DUF5672 family protein n=1 Tax=Massilia sp. S19_KUP03_FR1 TaxID=3025503 RepID=UPI002FCD9318
MTPPKPHLHNVSLVCVETRYPQLAQFSLDRCLAAASFRQCLLLSPQRFDLPGYIAQVAIAPIDSVEAYSAFMLRDLGRYFDGDFVLVVQWDSFILDGKLWDPVYLEYDYIGAPWSHRPLAVAVGNGGFSLRSRRLVDLLASMDFDVVHPEDAVICELRRDELEARGIRFAPRAVADRFAMEMIEPAAPTFGFHGFNNFHYALDDARLDAYLALCDVSMLRAPAARQLVRQLYHRGRHGMAMRMLRRRWGGTPRQRAETVRLAAHCLYHWAIQTVRGSPA